jgi:hypothetical protein
MTTNSKREQILEAVKDALETVPSLSYVQRRRPSFADLGTIPQTQLPFCAVVGKLPDPVSHNPGRQPGISDMFKSRLEIEMYIYAMDNQTPDSTVSNIADDIWAKLWSDPTFGGLVKGGFSVRPEIEVGYFDPYVVFKMICTGVYYHGIGGI